MTTKEIMTLAHKIAKTINLEGSYIVRMKLGLRAAHKIAKYESKCTANTHVEVCENHINISDSNNALCNKSGFISGFFLGSVMDFKETPGEKFTRLALEKFQKETGRSFFKYAS